MLLADFINNHLISDIYMQTINTTYEKFSQETLSFVKKTLGCSAAVFTWFDNIEHIPTYFHDGYNDDYIRQYYDEYLVHDPLNLHFDI